MTTARRLSVATTELTSDRSATVVMTVTIARPSSAATTESTLEKNVMEE